MIPKFSDAVTIDWERNDFAFKTVLTVRFCASMQYHIEDGDEVDFEEIKDLVVEQLRLEVANSVGGMLATAERETLERRIDELCTEVERLKGENAKLQRLAQQMYPYAKAHLQFGVQLGRNDTMSYDWALQMVDLGIEVPE